MLYLKRNISPVLVFQTSKTTLNCMNWCFYRTERTTIVNRNSNNFNIIFIAEGFYLMSFKEFAWSKRTYFELVVQKFSYIRNISFFVDTCSSELRKSIYCSLKRVLHSLFHHKLVRQNQIHFHMFTMFKLLRGNYRFKVLTNCRSGFRFGGFYYEFPFHVRPPAMRGHAYHPQISW